MALPRLSPSDNAATTRGKINDIMDLADQVPGKQDAFGLSNLLNTVSSLVTQMASKAAQSALGTEISDRQAAVANEAQARQSADTALQADVNARLKIADVQAVRGHDAGLYPTTRPGIGTWFFTTDTDASKAPEAFASLDAGKVISTDWGPAYNITTAAYLLSKQRYPVDPDGTYRVSAAFARFSVEDPNGDRIRLGLRCFDKTGALIQDKTLADWSGPSNGQRQDSVQYFALSPASGAINALPAGTVSVQPYLRTFGGAQSTALLRLGWQDGHSDQTINAADVFAALAAATNTVQQGQVLADLSRQWATRTDAEVVAGQGYGAKKYAQDAAQSATDLGTARDQAQLYRDQAGGYAAQSAAKGGTFLTFEGASATTAVLGAYATRPTVKTAVTVEADPDPTRNGGYLYDPAQPTAGLLASGFVKQTDRTLGGIDAKTSVAYEIWHPDGQRGQIVDVDAAGYQQHATTGSAGGYQEASALFSSATGYSALRIHTQTTSALPPVIGGGEYGQSLAIGGGLPGQAVVSTFSPRPGFLWMPGLWGFYPSGRYYNTVQEAYEQINTFNITPLGEMGVLQMMAGIQKRIFDLTGENHTLCWHVGGAGGTNIENLGRGSFAMEEFLRQIEFLHAAWRAKGREYKFLILRLCHGNENVGATSKRGYKAAVRQFKAMFNERVKRITGQTEDVQFFLTQVDTASQSFVTESDIPAAQYELTVEDADTHYCGTGYNWDHPDATHGNFPNYTWYREQAIRPIADVLCRNAGYATPGIFEARRIGVRQILCRHNVLVPPLRWDLSNEIVQSKYKPGFRGNEFGDGLPEWAGAGIGGAGYSAKILSWDITVPGADGVSPSGVVRNYAESVITLDKDPYEGGPWRIGVAARNPNLGSSGQGSLVTVTTTGGVITGYTIVNGGSGHDAVPDIIVSGAGTGAVLTAQITGGVLTGITIVNGGAGYSDGAYVFVVRRGAGRLANGTLMSDSMRQRSSTGWDGKLDPTALGVGVADPTLNPRFIDMPFPQQIVTVVR